MSEPTRVISGTDEADTEVELSAEDLLALSDSQPVAKREADIKSQPPRKMDATKASTRRGLSASRLSLAATVTIAFVGAAYVLTTSHDTAQSVAKTSQRASPSELPAPERKAEAQPVRFANPFDAEEVFEFPAGTSESEAREAVAEVLKERALSRQQT